MASIEQSALMPYSNTQMFALVNDIEAYPTFMSGCIGARVISREEGCVQAELTLSRAGFKQSFITKNTLLPPNEMQLRLVEGPFKTFEGAWLFDALSEGACKVTFRLQYEFSSVVLAFAAGKLFKQIASDQVASLRERADALYGKTLL